MTAPKLCPLGTAADFTMLSPFPGPPFPRGSACFPCGASWPVTAASCLSRDLLLNFYVHHLGMHKTTDVLGSQEKDCVPRTDSGWSMRHKTPLQSRRTWVPERYPEGGRGLWSDRRVSD
jgi:hypothetical protein